jgi:hypothetical protein
MTTAALALMILLSLAAQASADCDKQINLSPSAAGTAIGARGRARVRARFRPGRVQQDFRVEMDAVVPDGTTFLVFANGQPAGTITIAFRVGTLVVATDGGNTLPAGLDPVCAIRPVIVTDGAGTTILSGSF